MVANRAVPVRKEIPEDLVEEAYLELKECQDLRDPEVHQVYQELRVVLVIVESTDDPEVLGPGDRWATKDLTDELEQRANQDYPERPELMVKIASRVCPT